MRAFLHSLRYGVRQLSRSSSSLPALLTLAVGLSMAAGIDSLVSAILWDHLSVDEGERVVYLRGQNVPQDRDRLGVLPHDFRDLQADLSTIEHLTAFRQTRFNLSDEEGYPDRYSGAYVSAAVFDALRTEPVIGRRFRPEEDLPGASPVVLLGDRVWRNRFQSNPDVVGRVIQVNGEAAEIIGVLPPGFRFPRFHDLWAPLRLDLSEFPRGGGGNLNVFGRLRDGAQLSEAQAEVDGQMEQFAELFPDSNTGRTTLVQPYARRWVAGRWVSLFQMLFAGGLGVLALALVNLVVLLLGRAVYGLRDFAVRSALGASRGQLFLVFLGSSLVLTLSGALLAIPGAELLLRIYRSVMETSEGPFWMIYQVDARTFVFLFLLAVFCGLPAGVYPAMRTSRFAVYDLLKDVRNLSGGWLAGILRGLSIFEIAIAFVLLNFSVLLLGSLKNTTRIEIGDLDRAQVTTGMISVPPESYPEIADRALFLRNAVERLEAQADIEMVSAASNIPPAERPCRDTYEIEGRPPQGDDAYPQACRAAALPGHFEKLGLRLLEGREFGTQDQTDGLPVAILTESLASRAFPEGDALGKRLRIEPTDPESPWLTIVGVVEDGYMGWLDEDFNEGIYTPHAQSGEAEMVFLLTRRAGAERVAEEMLREEIRDLDRDLPVVEVQSWEKYLWNMTYSTRLVAFMYSILALAAAILALVGIYGVVSFSVGLRRREIGLRMALGADRPSVLRMILRDCAMRWMWGVALGVLIAQFAAEAVAGHLYGLTTRDPAAIALTALLVGVVVLIAGAIPARRASRLDPLETLRES